MSGCAAFNPHDHNRCRASALADLERAAERRGLRVTPIRRRVLELLLGSHRPMGAYELLDRLRAEGLNRQPPVVYRALDFLIAEGFVHRLEALNAYVACGRPGERHDATFLICGACRRVAEIPAPKLGRAVQAAAGEHGFAISRAVVEVDGLCPQCR